MGKWLLVRHGETEWNRTERAQGQADVPLNDAGKQQAAALGKALAEVRFDAAFSSDLSRAVETAHLLLDGRDLRPLVASELRERSFGRWEGFTFADAERDNPDLFARMLQQELTFAPPGGEDVQQLIARVKTFADQARSAHQESTLLIVAHAGSLGALVTTLLGLPAENFHRFRSYPGSLSIVEVRPRSASLLLWNDTSHYQTAL